RDERLRAAAVRARGPLPALPARRARAAARRPRAREHAARGRTVSLDEAFVLPGLAPLALLLAAGAWLLLRLAERARRRRLERVIGPRAAVLCAELGARRRDLRRALFAFGSAAAVIAWMQPLLGIDPERRAQRGIDLMICLDLSRSMLAADVAPSRLERAKAEIEALAGRLRGDRLGLVVFAGEARLTVPFTHDTASFVELLRLAEPSS